MRIRTENEVDRATVLQLHRDAFGRDAEAVLVERLRRDGVPEISLVAEVDGPVVGHVLFTEAQLVIGTAELTVGALGPVATASAHRRRGIADGLIREGLRRCWAHGWPAVIVLGDPAYYGRFGFNRADTWRIRCEFDAPLEAFMIIFADEPIQGPALAKYAPAFDSV